MLGFKSYYISFYTVVLVSTIHAVQTNMEHQQRLQVKVGEHIWHLAFILLEQFHTAKSRQYVPHFSPEI